MSEKKVRKRRSGPLYPNQWLAAGTSSKCRRVHAPWFYRKSAKLTDDELRELDARNTRTAAARAEAQA